jgi:hypothetical protein
MLRAILHRPDLIIPMMNGLKKPHQENNADDIPDHDYSYPHNAPFKPL